MPSRLDTGSIFFQIENYRGPEARMKGLRRYVWLRTALEGRRAAKAAFDAGCETICMFALGHAVFLPRKKSVRYFIYGDSTLKQLDKLYYNEEWDNARKRFFRGHLTKLAADGHQFLCMSNWYRNGLQEEYQVPSNQTMILRPPIDTDRWSPSDAHKNGKTRVLFLGGDFQRKGGNLVLDLARDLPHEGLEWHFVTREQPQEPFSDKNVHFQTDLKPDTPELIQLVQSCDLLVLPTQADCYSHAAIEAGACGLPTVISNVGGIADIVETGVNGTLLDTKNAIDLKAAVARYVQNPDRLKTEGLNARALVVERNAAAKHADTLASVLKG
jgi:glycosyltransferase involved in cell wall biosynthesis